MKKEIFLIVFFIISGLNLFLISMSYDTFSLYLKPFLMSTLFLYVYINDSFPNKKLLLIALSFSWIGDILLIFTNNNQWFFITGLLTFLTAHIFYIVLFSKLGTSKPYKNNPIFWIGIIVTIFYLKSILQLLLPSLGPLKIPVTFYAFTISAMLGYAWRGYISWNSNARFYILFGAIAFIASDSFLAINKFHEPINKASLLIMTTYLIAQFCIVYGIINLNRQQNLGI
jgi:uncharacterized membrane protein YhhN